MVDEQVENYVSHLSGRVWGISIGLVSGIGLFLATIILVIKGGDDVGQHLGLLSAFFPGYDVTVLGGFIGFAYAFVAGYLLGRLICFFYSLAARNESPESQ